MRKLAIVGNAPLEKGQAAIIDACEWVVRFNEWKNHRGDSGQRVDVLCVTNTGNPAEIFIRDRLIGSAPFLSHVSEIWFPRDFPAHQQQARQFDRTYPDRKLLDRSDEIVASNQLHEKRIVRFSSELNQQVFAALRARSATPFLCPSTGALTIAHGLEDPRFAGYEKLLFGFGFQGWHGHPWEAEKALAQHHCATREDVRFLAPAVTEPAPPRHPLAAYIRNFFKPAKSSVAK